MKERIIGLKEKDQCFIVKNGYSEVCNSFFEPYLGKIDPKDVLANYGSKLEIPRGYLYGTQPINEYKTATRKIVERRLDKCGIECLRRNPPMVCALFENNHAYIAILDGHNRIRYSAQQPYSLHDIPSLVLSVEEMVELMNRYNPDKRFDTGSMSEKIKSDVAETLTSFNNLPEYKFPKPLPGIINMTDLKNHFPTFQTD